MSFNFNDDEVREFVVSIKDTPHLKQKLEEYGATETLLQAIKWVEHFDNPLPQDAENELQKFLCSICPEYCHGCGAPIPLSEMAEAIDNGGYCSACIDRQEKIAKE